MIVLGRVRDVASRTVTPREKPAFTVHELICEFSDPLEIAQVRIPRDYEGQLNNFKELSGSDCLIPLTKNAYGDLSLTATPRPAKSKEQPARAVSNG